MADLRAFFTNAGCEAVRTYVQSGNVAFRATSGLAELIPALVASTIKERYGYAIPVILRTADELRNVVNSNPFLSSGADMERLHVAFLADVPNDAGVVQLDPDHSPPDAFHVSGREIFLHCPNGVARTKLTNGYFDSKLATTSTIRNWRTVLALLEMASGG